jgi:prefoldin subunit 5
MAEKSTEEQLRIAKAVIDGYSDSIKDLMGAMRKIAEPIRARMKDATAEAPADPADAAVITALTSLMDTLEESIKKVGDAIHD